MKRNGKRVLSLMFLIPILAVQVSFSMGRWNEPILDGRLHWYFDNAAFLLRAKHSNDGYQFLTGDKRRPFLNLFGTATYVYGESGKGVRLTYYSHHPILSPAMFRVYTDIFGYENWVPRSFALVLSLATTVVLFLLFKVVLKDDLLSGLITLLYTLFPLNFMFMDQWKYEIATSLLLIASFYFLVRISGSVKYRPVLLCTVFLLFQSDWIAYLVVPGLLYYVYNKRKEPMYEGLFGQLIFMSLLACLMNFVILYQLGFDLKEIVNAGKSRMAAGMETVGIKAWFLMQCSYLEMNFGQTNLAVCLMALAYLLLRRRSRYNALLFAGLVLVVSSILFSVIFRNLSLIHHYIQWYWGLAYALLLGGILANVSVPCLRTRDARIITLAVAIPLLLLTVVSAQKLNQEIRVSTFGSPSDLEAVRSLRNRLLVFSDGRSGPPDWWFGPVIELAQDPIFQETTGRGSVQSIEQLSAIYPKDVVVVLNTEKALNSFRQVLRKQFGIHRLQRVARSHSFSFFTIVDG